MLMGIYQKSAFCQKAEEEDDIDTEPVKEYYGN